jgi:2'-5' RNA ligase
MAQIQPDVLKRSVTRDEAESGMSHYWIAPLAFGAGAGLVSMPYEPPAYWSRERDIALRDAYRRGAQWASAVNIAVTRVGVSGYELDGDVGLRVRRAREMLGSSWIDAVQRLAMDYVTTDNGGFWEIVRATKAYGSRVLGIVPLSSIRCIRTGDPERPVIYVDRLGRYHELRAHQVAGFSDMPDEDYFGVGLSATSRAWDAIYEDMAVSAYFKEKATGRRPLALYFMTGMADQAIEDTLKTAQEDASRKGLLSFMGAAIKGNPNNVPLNLVTVPLASLPDGFNQEKHEELRDIKFAAALGIDPSDLNPRLIGNRQLGAGSQAQVLDDKQDSKGLIALRQKIAAFMNDTETWHPLPGGVTFAWSERDLKDQQAKAGIAQTRAQTRAAQIQSGEITTEEARQLAVDAGDIPQSFIPVDKTDEETLTDEDKADSGQLPEATPEVQSTQGTPAPMNVQPAVKLAELRALLYEVVAYGGIAAKEGHTGAMVALYPPQSQALAISAGLDAVSWPPDAKVTQPSEMHITLAFLGEAASIDEARRREMATKAEDMLREVPEAVRFNGIARFNGSESDGDAVVVLLSSSRLNALAANVRREIGDESEHPFLAHMTLAYIPKDAPTPTVPPPFDALRIDRLSLVFADKPFAEWKLKNGVALPKADPRQTGASAPAAALKAARGSTLLARIIPSPTNEPATRKDAIAYWKRATTLLEGVGEAWKEAARGLAPSETGELKESISYELTGRNSPTVTLKLIAGNKERPEVAIRAVLYGRRGFAPKRAKALRFTVGGQTVFARKVKGALANDWLSKSLKAIEPTMREAERELASVTVNSIEVSDIPGAIKRTRQSQIQAPKTPKTPKRKRK